MIAGERGEMRDVWVWSLDWFRRPASNPDRRAKQTEIVAAILGGLRAVETVAGLHLLYAQDSRWCTEIARERVGDDWRAIGVHAATATAFGLRYVELVTGRDLDATALPPWLGEWSAF